MKFSICFFLVLLLVRAGLANTSKSADAAKEDEITAVVTHINDTVHVQRRRQQEVEQQSLVCNPQFFTPQPQSSQQEETLDASNVFGLLFNVRSKDNGVQFTGFELYTTSADENFYYELYTRTGDYWPIDNDNAVGGIETFDLLSQGLTKGSTNCSQEVDEGTALYCTLAVVPKQAFLPSQWPISEKNQWRTFYITLSSQNLVVRNSNSITQPAASERVVVSSTPDLDLFEGIGTKTYPYSTSPDYYLERPMGFIGKIHYSVVNADDQPQLAPPTPSSPSSPPPAVTTQQPPTTTPQPTATPIIPSTVASPTMKPTRPKCRPGRPCPTESQPDAGATIIMPTSKPITIIQTIVYIENTPPRALNAREISKYIEVMQSFLDQSTSLEDNGVTTLNITVVNDDLIQEPKQKGKGGSRKGSGYLRKNTPLTNGINTTASYAYYHNEVGGNYIPKIYPAIFVQTTFEVITELPYDVAAFYLWNEFRTNEEELISLFHDNSLFVSYFREITNVTVQVVNELIAPTASPTKFIDNTTIVESENSVEPERANIWMYLGITIGVVWLVLTCCSFRQIINHRRSQRYRQDLRRLTRQFSPFRSTFGRRNSYSFDQGRFSMAVFSPSRIARQLFSTLFTKQSGDGDSNRSDDSSLQSFG